MIMVFVWNCWGQLRWCWCLRKSITIIEWEITMKKIKILFCVQINSALHFLSFFSLAHKLYFVIKNTSVFVNCDQKLMAFSSGHWFISLWIFPHRIFTDLNPTTTFSVFIQFHFISSHSEENSYWFRPFVKTIISLVIHICKIIHRAKEMQLFLSQFRLQYEYKRWCARGMLKIS